MFEFQAFTVVTFALSCFKCKHSRWWVFLTLRKMIGDSDCIIVGSFIVFPLVLFVLGTFAPFHSALMLTFRPWSLLLRLHIAKTTLRCLDIVANRCNISRSLVFLILLQDVWGFKLMLNLLGIVKFVCMCFGWVLMNCFGWTDINDWLWNVGVDQVVILPVTALNPWWFALASVQLLLRWFLRWIGRGFVFEHLFLDRFLLRGQSTFKVP